MNKDIKKVLMVNDHNIGTGIGIYFNNLYQHFRKISGINVDMLLQNQKPKLVQKIPHDFVQYRPFNIHGKNIGYIYTFLSYYYYPHKMPSGYDIYHFSNQMMGRCAKFNHPSVVTVHDIQPFKFRKNHPKIEEYYRRRHIESLISADFLIFISESTKTDFFQLFEFDEAKTRVIHHGISRLFKPREKIDCRKELNLPQHDPIILHVGTEAKRKNPITLFKILAELEKSIPNILLLRIGKKNRKIQDEVAKLDIAENIQYMSGLPVEKLAKVYNSADVFVFPSIYEGFGFPVLEALKSGCPVVASNATSIPEIVEDAGFLHDPMDVEGFVKSIHALLSQEKNIEFSQRSLERSKNFSWELTATKTNEVYNMVLQNNYS